MYVTAWFDQRVSVLSTADHSVKRAISFDGMVRPITVDRAERWMYVASSGLHGFVVADLEAGKAARTVEHPPYPQGAPVPRYNTLTHGLAIRPGEQELYVTSTIDDKIYIYTVPDCTLVGSVQTGDQPNWTAFNRDGTRAYISNAGDNTVSEIDTTSRAVLATIRVGHDPRRLALVGAQSSSSATPNAP